MTIEIAIAREPERAILENLLSLYIHDFSEILGNLPGPDGRFAYDRLPLYFEEEARTPFLIRFGGALAGFALISQGSLVGDSPAVRDMSEFFVVRALRRRGVGAMAAAQLFSRFPGPWEVRVMERNEAACAFWARAISHHTAGTFRVDRWESAPRGAWRVFRFEEPGDVS